MKYALLENRSVIKICGAAKAEFLQNLLTNDVTKVDAEHMQYSMLLSPQGRFLYDFYIFSAGDDYLLDCQISKLEEIINKFTRYKLRQDVHISKTSLKVIAWIDSMKREIVEDLPNAKLVDFQKYEEQRILKKIPDADKDFIFDKSFPLEFGAVELGAIDFEKGCYVGQEVVARTNYRGVVRKRLYVCHFSSDFLPKGEELLANEKKVGIMLGSVPNLGLCLLNSEELSVAKEMGFKIICSGVEVLIDD